jgi:GTP-binding protein
VVVLVGRPNVGKSTLFNRLTRSRRALVHDLPGVTRDRIVAEAESPEGAVVTVVDTGGLLLEGGDAFVPLIRAQAEAALRDASAAVLLLDGATGPVPEDQEIAQYLRSLEVPVVPVVNKSDRSEVGLASHEFFRLGLGEPIPVSAEHGLGIDELWDALSVYLLDEAGSAQPDATDEPGCNVAIIGRPNVGKSSLLNRLVGEERALVSEIPGTTRDAVDVLLQGDEATYRFVDTAGIRRKGRTDRGPEVLSVVMARRQIERAQVCVLVIDVTEGVTRQDAHIAGYAWDEGRALAIGVNKWDLVEDRANTRAEVLDQIAQSMKFVRDTPVLFFSAKTGRRTHQLLPTLDGLAERHSARFPSAELNRAVRSAWDRQPPTGVGKREPKLFYATQVNSRPPTVRLFTNVHSAAHFSYLRYIENSVRSAFDLSGVPLRVTIKGRGR